MREARVIVTVLLDKGGLYKTEKYKSPKYIGDPINAIKIFNDKCIDEMCVLDITATHENRTPDWNILQNMASQAFFPMSYGGGLKSVDHVRKLFSLGFEKAVFTSALIDDVELVKDSIREFGQSAITGYINVKKKMLGNHNIYDYRKNKILSNSVNDFLKLVEVLGVGEIIVNSVDFDGTLKGYDWSLIELLRHDISTPIVISGGASGISDFKKAISAENIDSCSGGACFVYFGPLNAVLLNYPDFETLEANLD